jgi:hypothetical protein
LGKEKDMADVMDKFIRVMLLALLVMTLFLFFRWAAGRPDPNAEAFTRSIERIMVR